MSSPLAIRADGVTKRFGEFVAVGDLSFAIPRGVIYGMLGPNGAGKTTMLRMINDIFAPDEGTIEVCGLRPGREAGRRIGYLPEERGLFPKMRVLEMLGFFGEVRGLAAREATARAGALLDRLGLADWKQNKVQDLSKGMQQKVQFATALIHEPELLILDEPWSGLDPINADVLRDLVREQKQAGRTILFSTHLMEQAEKLCDQVCIIARGTRVLEGDLREIKRQAASGRSFALAFDDADALARAEEGVLADRALVTGAVARDDHVEVELAADAGALLAALVAAKLPVRRFERVEPTLHEIFVDRVGDDAAADKQGRQ